jgi:hypothetical protein
MIIGITGKMGSGKTLLMSIFGYFFRFLEIPVFANYSMDYRLGVETISSLKDLIEIENGVILIDEIHLNIDSRQWYREKDIKFTHWVNQTRKRNLILIYTSQHFKQVDVRLRRATDLLIHCLNFGTHFKFLFIDPTTETLLKILRMEKEKAKPFYQIYNTFEFIYPLN